MNQSVIPTSTIVGKSLLWVAVLLLIIIYIYAVISFAFLRSEFTKDPDNNMFCERLDECFISVLRFGLIDNFLVCVLYLMYNFGRTTYVAYN